MNLEARQQPRDLPREEATVQRGLQSRETRAQLQLAAAVARRHFLDAATNVEIAEEFGISRFKVARMIELARDAGLVTIQVHDPRGIDTIMSQQLQELLGVERVLVVDHASDARAAVGAVAAGYLQDTVVAGSNVGLAWSRSTQALTEHLTDLPRCTIVQLCGVVANAYGEEHNVELVRRAARRAKAASVTFYAPLVVPDAATASALGRQAGITEALAHCDNLRTAVIAVGLWAPRESTVYDALTEAEREHYRRAGTVAETCGILIAEDGTLIADGLQDRTLAVSADQLRRTRDVVALATDAERAPAAAALARSGLLTTLITHRELARELLADQDGNKK